MTADGEAIAGREGGAANRRACVFSLASGSDGPRPGRGSKGGRRNAETNLVRELISKLVAGGLSAAVILLWWPRFFPADNATTWLVRGVVWTLSFELLIHALLPIEKALWDSRVGVRVRSRAGARLGSPRRSVRGRAGVACAALSVPVVLLVAAPQQPAKPKSFAAVRHVTEVKRIVKVERRQVRVAQVVPVEVAAPQLAAAVSPAAPASYRKPVSRPTGTQQRSGSRKPDQSTGNAPSGTKATTGGSQGTASTPEQSAAAPSSTGR